MTKSVNEVAERLQQTDKTFVWVDGNDAGAAAEAVVKGDFKVFVLRQPSSSPRSHEIVSCVTMISSTCSMD